MAMALDSIATCPNCGERSIAARESLYWLSDSTNPDTTRAQEALAVPPNPLSLEPLSRTEVALFATGLIAILVAAIGPIIVAPLIFHQVTGLTMLFSSIWAITCPYLYLRTVEAYLHDQYGEKALARWESLKYCPHCDSVFGLNDRGVMPSQRATTLLYE